MEDWTGDERTEEGGVVIVLKILGNCGGWERRCEDMGTGVCLKRTKRWDFVLFGSDVVFETYKNPGKRSVRERWGRRRERKGAKT